MNTFERGGEVLHYLGVIAGVLSIAGLVLTAILYRYRGTMVVRLPHVEPNKEKAFQKEMVRLAHLAARIAENNKDVLAACGYTIDDEMHKRHPAGEHSYFCRFENGGMTRLCILKRAAYDQTVFKPDLNALLRFCADIQKGLLQHLAQERNRQNARIDAVCQKSSLSDKERNAMELLRPSSTKEVAP